MHTFERVLRGSSSRFWDLRLHKALRRLAVLALALFAAGAAQAQEPGPPFQTRELVVPGRVIQAWGAHLGAPCPRGAKNLFVLSASGVAPREIRRATAFPCASDWPDTGVVAPAWSVELPTDITGIDTADAHAPWPGEEMLWISSEGLRLAAGDGSGGVLRIANSGPLPLPSRTRGISRLPVAGDWNSDGTISVLLPTTGGVRWLRPSDGAHRELAMPIEAEYRNASSEPPADAPELTKAFLNWPEVTRADDNGDGRLDLFALWRFGAWVFRVSETGLPQPAAGTDRAEPTRRQEFKPFDDEQEIRHESSNVQIFVEDLNRDGFADLVVDRTIGGMLSSWASTEVHLNDGSGVRLSGEPAASLEKEGAIAGIAVVDLDGDGSSELFQTMLEFNAVQLIRFFATGNANVDFAVLALDPGSETGLRESWSDDVSLKLDWETGRIAGIFPDLRGDWNGDGRPDLIYPSGEKEVAFRLGMPTGDGPGFGDRVADQPFPLAAAAIWPEDLDGDGLQDLVTFDERDEQADVFVLLNRGRLPGTPESPSLQPAD